MTELTTAFMLLAYLAPAFGLLAVLAGIADFIEWISEVLIPFGSGFRFCLHDARMSFYTRGYEGVCAVRRITVKVG